jgi:hypothetical protein
MRLFLMAHDPIGGCSAGYVIKIHLSSYSALFNGSETPV